MIMDIIFAGQKCKVIWITMSMSNTFPFIIRYGSVFKPASHPFVQTVLSGMEGKQREGALNLIRDLHMIETEKPARDGVVFRTQMDRDFDLKEVSSLDVDLMSLQIA